MWLAACRCCCRPVGTRQVSLAARERNRQHADVTGSLAVATCRCHWQRVGIIGSTYLPAWHRLRGKDLGGWPTAAVIRGGSSNLAALGAAPYWAPNSGLGRRPPDKACKDVHCQPRHRPFKCHVPRYRLLREVHHRQIPLDASIFAMSLSW